jgi:hypothetical protein
LALWQLTSLPSRTKLQWIVELEELLDNDVSLVLVSPETDPVLGMEIVRHGIVVFEAEPELWFNKRLDLWHTYNDSLPFLRRQQESLQKFAEEVGRGT